MQQWQPIDIPAGRDGISRAKNLSLLRPSHLAYADNVVVDRFVCEKIPGSSKINTVPLGDSVLAHYDYIVNGGQELVAYYIDGPLSAGIATVDAGGVVTSLKSGLTNPTNPIPWFSEGWDGTQKALYVSNGYDPVQVHVFGGVSTSDVPSPSVDWTSGSQPSWTTPTGTRMVAYGVQNFLHTLYFSVPGTHGDYVNAGSAVEIVYPGIGQSIAGAKSFRERLYVAKYPNGIVYIDDSDPNVANWTRGIVTDSIGISGPGCWVDIGDDIILLASDGNFYALSQVRTLGQASTPPLLPQETSEFLKDIINIDYLHLARSIWFGYRRQAWFAVPINNNAATNSAIIILDFNEPNNPKVLYSTRDFFYSLALRRSPTSSDYASPSWGDLDGFLWQGDKTARNNDSVSYVAQYETVPVAMMPGGVQRANLEELQVVMQPQGNWDLDIEVLRDGVPSQTLAFSMQTPGAGSGSVSLDSDVIAGQTIATVRHRLEGDCRYLKLIGRNENANENFAVMSHIVRVTPGNDR